MDEWGKKLPRWGRERGKIDHVILEDIKERKRNTGGRHIHTSDFSKIDFKMFTEKL